MIWGEGWGSERQDEGKGNCIKCGYLNINRSHCTLNAVSARITAEKDVCKNSIMPPEIARKHVSGDFSVTTMGNVHAWPWPGNVNSPGGDLWLRSV